MNKKPRNPSRRPANKPSNAPGTKIPRYRSGPGTATNLDPFLSRYGMWLTLGLVLFASLVIYHKFLLGNSYYLFRDIGSDTLTGHYPNFVLAVDYFRHTGFPLWAFEQGMGQNIMWPTLMDPFFFIVYLAGKVHIMTAVIWMEEFKVLVTAIIVYRWFKINGMPPLICAIGTLLYCFSGFMVVGGSWFQFSTEGCYLALLLFSFDKLYRQGSWYLFPPIIALIATFQPFNVYLYGMFLLIYFLFRHVTNPEATWTKFGKTSFQLASFGLLGLLISSFFAIGVVQLMLDSPRVGGTSSYFGSLKSTPWFWTESALYYKTIFGRLMANDFMGNGSGFKGWVNYLEAPMLYTGILPLVVLPQLFAMEGKRVRITAIAVMGLFFMILVFPFFRYAFWLFSGDYFRGLSFFVAVFILILSLQALAGILASGRTNLYVLFPTAGLWLLLVAVYSVRNPDFTQSTVTRAVLFFIILYTALLAVLPFARQKAVVIILVLAGMAAELIFLNYRTVNERDVLTRADARKRVGYNDYTVDAIRLIKSREHRHFYRVNKDYVVQETVNNSLNDAKVLGYFGTVSYHSFNQKNYIRFLEKMELIHPGNELESRWSIGIMFRPVLYSFSSVRYQLDKSREFVPYFKVLGFDSIATTGDVTIYENHEFLPLGFTYDVYFPMSSFDSLSRTGKEMVIHKAVVAESPVDDSFHDLGLFRFTDTTHVYPLQEFLADLASRRADTLAVSYFSENNIIGNISLKRPKLLFMTIPFDPGWHAHVDGKEAQLLQCNVGFSGLMLQPGEHRVELWFRPAWFYPGMIASILGVVIYGMLILWSRMARRKNSC